jgi:hypothetical protein
LWNFVKSPFTSSLIWNSGSSKKVKSCILFGTHYVILSFWILATDEIRLSNAAFWKQAMFPTYSVALQSFKDLGRITYERFLKLFRHLVGLLGRVINQSQGLYLHRTTQHRKTRTNIHAPSGIRTHDSCVPAIKAHAPDCKATVFDNVPCKTILKSANTSSIKREAGQTYVTQASLTQIVQTVWVYLPNAIKLIISHRNYTQRVFWQVTDVLKFVTHWTLQCISQRGGNLSKLTKSLVLECED